MKVIKGILLIVILGAMTPILWVLAPFYLDKGEEDGN